MGPMVSLRVVIVFFSLDAIVIISSGEEVIREVDPRTKQ